MTDSATIAAITTTSAPASRASTPSYSPAETVALPDTASLGAEDAKEQLRTVLRSHRRSRHRHSGHGHSSVCRAFTERALEALGGARSVAAYVSVGHEPCTRQLLDRLAERDIEVLLPVLGPHLARSWGDFRGSRDLAERAPGRPPRLPRRLPAQR